MIAAMAARAEQQLFDLPCVRGVGIDLVQISEIARMGRIANGALLRHLFSVQELQEAEQEAHPASYLAGRFAVKEAAFKAVAHLLPQKIFDLRLIETLRQPDGSPQIVRSEPLDAILQAASVSALHVSITNEADYAMAVVVCV